MANFSMQRPDATEHADYFAKYVNLVPGNDVVSVLRGQIGESLSTLRAVSDQESLCRYAEGKWTLREVVGHMIDTERIFAYRALRFARGDARELQGFDQDPYIVAAEFDKRLWPSLLDEFELVRRANVLMLDGLPDEAWVRRGVANGKEATVRAIAYMMAGHEAHHMKIVRERYLAA